MLNARFILDRPEMDGWKNQSTTTRLGGTLRQASLPTLEPAIVPVCFYCHQPKGRVMRDREAQIAQVRHSGGRFTYPATPAEAQEVCVCCTPESDHRCARCNSMQLQFGLFEEISFDGTDERETAHCDDCGWFGDAQETTPPKQPWAELEE